MKNKKPDEVLAQSLRHFANLMCNSPDSYSVEDGKAMDRALRSCKGITDIDVVWVRWGFIALSHNWLTDKDMIITKSGWRYKESK